MPTAFTKNCAARTWLGVLIVGSLFACQVRAQYAPNWTRNFRVGALGALNIKGDFKLRGTFDVSGGGTGDPSDPNADHFYDDGYVRVDDTGNARGYTSFWGYDSASQYNANSHTLLMHSSSSYTATGGASADNEFSVGFDLAYGGNLRRWRRVRLGWEFGFGLLPVEIKDRSPIDAQINRTNYTYNTGSIIVPGAPYEGGASGIGPTIDAAVDGVSVDTTSGTILGSRSLDVNLYTFRLGPTLFWDASRRIGVSAGFGPAIGIASETYKFDEVLPGRTEHNRGSFGKTDIVYGGYVNLMATYHAEENGDIYVGVQYMPMTGSTLSKDGREAHLDLGGQLYFTAGVNWPF